ncbi:MAG: hypothetical protein C5B59_15295 [Bacteroidetes bacterium]|nr:MAG: hypothetical protein C5B59_15295 [Bacteroidota bacterium]
MKSVFIANAFLICFCLQAIGQGKVTGTLKGRIVDTTGKQVMADASVTLTLAADSTEPEFTITDKTGSFYFKNLKASNYHVVISFEGYQAIVRRFSITADKMDIDLGLLYMQKQSDLLEEVIIQRPPIQVKKDTVEYNASMFHTKPNALAEDLLKKLPGVQVDKDGNITAQGEKVTRVLVNGKRFFSDDPKLATRNLPPDIIDKIQVFDDLSDQSKFTGFDDGNRVKTINITTKKDKKQGYFGKVVAGAGTNETYDASVNMHRFNGNQQISLLGQANDINKQNFTVQDILGTTGGRRGANNISGNSNTGITTVWAGGFNYKDAWSPKTDAYGSYFFNSQHVSVDQQSHTQNTIPGTDSSTINDQDQSNIQRTQNHRIFFNLEQRFDSSNSLIFRPNFTFQKTTPETSSNTMTSDDKGAPINNSTAHNTSTNSGYNINGANLQLRHKFAKRFRTISLDLNLTANVNDGDGYNKALNIFYKPLSKIDTINQYFTDSLHSVIFSPTLSYTEPIAKNQILEFNYNYTYNRNNSINNTFNFNEQAHDYLTFDSLFSNSYKFISNANRFSLNWRIQNPKYNLSIGSGIQFTDFSSLNTTKNVTVAQHYINLTPTVNFQYTFSKTQHFRLNYSGRTGTPSVAQLQPIVTTSDSINFQIGNPDLKPQFTHSLRMLYSSFDPGTQRVLFATINASTIVNDIQNSIVQHPNGGTTTSYVNLNGTYNISGYFNYGFPLKKPKSNLNFITNAGYNQSQNLVNEVSNFTRNTTLGETISWTTNLRKNFDMNFSAGSTYNIAQSAKQNFNYFSYMFSTELTGYTNNGWLIAANFDYSYSGNRPPGYNASVPLLSPSIAKQLFKKKNGELRLSIFDLLNKNQAVNRTVTANQIVDTRTNTLTRYVMLTFTYNLNNFADPSQKRMPGMFNNFHRYGGMKGGAP